jgi:hypothetical protein
MAPFSSSSSSFRSASVVVSSFVVDDEIGFPQARKREVFLFVPKRKRRAVNDTNPLLLLLRKRVRRVEVVVDA